MKLFVKYTLIEQSLTSIEQTHVSEINEALLCKTLEDNADPIRLCITILSKHTSAQYSLAMMMTTICVENDVQGIK